MRAVYNFTYLLTDSDHEIKPLLKQCSKHGLRAPYPSMGLATPIKKLKLRH